MNAGFVYDGRVVRRVSFPYKKTSLHRGYTWRLYFDKKAWTELIEWFPTREAAAADLEREIEEAKS